MRPRIWLAALVVAVIIGTGLAPAPATIDARLGVAQASDGTGLAILQRTYDILLDQYYGPLEPTQVLAAGWAALVQAARDNGLPTPAALPSLPADRAAAFAAFATAYRAFVVRLPSDAPTEVIGFVVAQGMIESVREGHTYFLPPDAYARILSSLGGGGDLPIGLGVQLSPSAPWEIRRIAPTGPAARAGLMVGDVIVAVDGRDVSSASPEVFRQAIGGPEGTRRVFAVLRGGAQIEAAVVRGPFYFPPLDSRLLPGKAGYIKLDSFVVSGAPLPDKTEILAEFDRRLDELEAAGATGLVLDLRGNGGGLTFTAAEILGRFLPEDSIALVQQDTRGRQSVELAGGGLRRVQLPMVVLVDGDSASSSEVVASALREYNRALIVGERTAGVLATALIQPLPEGAGMSVAVAEVLTGVQRFKIDTVGFPVDIEAPAPTAADTAAGRDPQLEAAVRALATAPTPPASRPLATGMTPADIVTLLRPYMPSAARIPTTDRLPTANRLSERQFTYTSQWINYIGPPHDPLTLRQTVRARGWLGSQVQEYGAELLVPPGISVIADLYSGEAGAREAAATNDFPDLQEPVPTTVQLGDGAVAAYKGVWMAAGGYVLVWRRGTVVFTVAEYDDPGQESPELVAAIAQQVDALFTANPLVLPPVAGVR